MLMAINLHCNSYSILSVGGRTLDLCTPAVAEDLNITKIQRDIFQGLKYIYNI